MLSIQLAAEVLYPPRRPPRLLVALHLPAANTAQFYVSASRGRKSVSVFTDDKQALREAVQKTDKRLSATEVFGKEPRRIPSLWKRSAFMNRLRYNLNSRINAVVFDRNRDRERAALEY